MKAGIIDRETLNGGLSYFTQDLLSFTVPGLVRYLRENKVDEEIVKGLLTDSVPTSVLELVDRSTISGTQDKTAITTSMASPVHPLESLKATLSSSPPSRLAIVDRLLSSPDLLLSSLLLTLPIPGPPLLEDAIRDYLPRYFKAAVQNGTTSSPFEKTDQIADGLACALHRQGGAKAVERAYAEALARNSRGEQGMNEMEKLFWERVRAF
jgi:hypothetical protein